MRKAFVISLFAAKDFPLPGVPNISPLGFLSCFLSQSKGSLDLGQYAETVTLAWANADWSKAAKVKVFFLDADRKPVAEAVTALIKGESQEN